jgi:hypothetical protein
VYGNTALFFPLCTKSCSKNLYTSSKFWYTEEKKTAIFSYILYSITALIDCVWKYRALLSSVCQKLLKEPIYFKQVLVHGGKEDRDIFIHEQLLSAHNEQFVSWVISGKVSGTISGTEECFGI